jgi:glyoxylase-like metal-dependent hydrolase (beta-lactamase superfamily II)
MNRPENPFAPRTYGQWEVLTPRVGLWRNIVNSTVFVGDRGVAVVDTQVNHALAKRLVTAIQAAYGKPILYAVNTHYHWDHTSGNAVFKAAGATLVASRRTAAAMVERAPRQKGFLSGRGFELGPDPLQPDLFADDVKTLDLGGLTLELHAGHDAETADPTLVWSPEEKVLAAGDTVMTGSFPIFGQPSQREGLENDGWLAALDEVRGFGASVVAPGHGPSARTADLAQLEKIMRWFLDNVRRMHAAGHSLNETIRVLEDEMPAWITRIPVVWGTPRYAILRVWAGLADLGQPGWQHLKPTAIPAAKDSAIIAENAADLAAWRERVAQAMEGGDIGGAVATAEAMTQAHPDAAPAWALLANTLVAASRGIASVLEKGDCFGKARAALDRALELDPACGEAWLQAGQFHIMMAYRNGDDPGRGLAALERAAADARLDARQRAEVAFYRAIAARARGDEAAARGGFAESLRQDPSFRPALLAQMG